GGEIQRQTLVLQDKFALPHLQSINRDRKQVVETQRLASLLRSRGVRGAIGKEYDVNNRMYHGERMKAQSSTQGRMKLHRREHAVHMHIRKLPGGFASMDREIANLHFQLEWNYVKAADFNASACGLLYL